MKNVTMLTIVPNRYARDFKEKGRISNFSTLPQIHPKAMEVIRNFVKDNVGYDNLPLASLKCATAGSLDGVDLQEYLSMNAHDSVLYQLEIPEDMIVSIDYDSLLRYSDNMKNSFDNFQLLMEQEMLTEELFIGIADDSEGMISFIPFLDYNRCKFYAKLDRDFKLHMQHGKSAESAIHLKALTSFGM